MTSLLFGAREGHLAIVRKLVQCRANVDMKNEVCHYYSMYSTICLSSSVFLLYMYKKIYIVLLHTLSLDIYLMEKYSIDLHKTVLSTL